MAKTLIYSKSQAKAILQRFEADMNRNEAEAVGGFEKNLGPSGYAGELIELVSSYVQIVDSMGYDGDRVTAQALETVERAYNSPLNELRMFVVEYIETLSTPSAVEYTNKKQAQYERNVTNIRVAMDEAIDQILTRLEQEEEKEKEREERRKERERRRQEQERLEAEYYRTRSNLQRQIRRREQAGVDIDIEIPDIPQRITQGSINRLEDLIDYIQDEYRYLVGRGYRGSK